MGGPAWYVRCAAEERGRGQPERRARRAIDREARRRGRRRRRRTGARGAGGTRKAGARVRHAGGGDASAGTLLWMLDGEEAVQSSPALGPQGRIFAGGADGALHAWQPEAGADDDGGDYGDDDGGGGGVAGAQRGLGEFVTFRRAGFIDWRLVANFWYCIFFFVSGAEKRFAYCPLRPLYV